MNFDLNWTGYNGRCNKIADTCYAFWVGASLDVSHSNPMVFGLTALLPAFPCALSLLPLFPALYLIPSADNGLFQMLNHPSLPCRPSLRRWLLEKTAHHTLGGFGKLAGDLPDVYHSYLGLAALSLTGDDLLKPLDATMCISQEAKGRLKGIWKRWGVEGGESDFQR